jgi:uncharacterized protein YidB (DUF937 family)
MGLFTTLAEMVVTGFGNPDSTEAKVAGAVMKRLQTNDGGGLSELLHQLEEQGLGHIAQSWVGTGANQPISAEQIQKVLGSDWMQQVAARLGVSPDVVAAHLSEILPKIVDRLTPDGQVPAAAAQT